MLVSPGCASRECHQVYGVVQAPRCFRLSWRAPDAGGKGIRSSFRTKMKSGTMGKCSFNWEEDLNISHTVNIPVRMARSSSVQIDGKIDLTCIKEKFEKEEFQVEGDYSCLCQSPLNRALEPRLFCHQKAVKSKIWKKWEGGIIKR